MGNKDIFDFMAKTYDSPERIKIADISAKEIRKHIKENSKDKKAIDYGCGTGLVGLALSDEFESMLLADISSNMIKCVDEKIKGMNIKNAKAIHIEETEEMSNITPVDYIIVVQTLLHIKDTDNILQSLFNLINTDGKLIIVDFVKNDLVESDLVHNGFILEELSETLKMIGFSAVNIKDFYNEDNIFMNKNASMFIAVAKK